MTALEVRILSYAIAGLLLIGFAGWCGYILTAHHYERLEAAEEASRSAALQIAQQHVIDVENAQAAAMQAAENQYAALTQANSALSDRLASSLQNYTQLRSGILSATGQAATAAHDSAEGARRNTELVGLVRQATDACLGDAAQLQALETWARTSSQ